jgi:phosphotransferase system IIA component
MERLVGRGVGILPLAGVAAAPLGSTVSTVAIHEFVVHWHRMMQRKHDSAEEVHRKN